MANPGFPLDCPKCGERMAYLRSEGENHFYMCQTHGLIMLDADGRVRLGDDGPKESPRRSG